MSFTRSIPLNTTPRFYKKEAKRLLKQYQSGNTLAKELFAYFHPRSSELREVNLSDAQLVIARHYGQSSWSRLIEMVESNKAYKMLEKAFHFRNKKSIDQILSKYPILFDRMLLRLAVLYGDIRLVEYMYELGARDVQDALGQSIYGCSGHLTDYLISKGGDMEGKDRFGLLGLSSCELQNLSSLKFTLSYRSQPIPQEVLIELASTLIKTYVRNPIGKHECFEELIGQGLIVEDSPIMAFHRGRIDLLEKHLKSDPELINRRFTLNEIFCEPFFDNPSDGLHLTPVDGTTLLHLAVEYDDRDVMKWLVDHGADVNAESLVDQDGFGGHTPIFHTVVTFTPDDTSKAALLLQHGANPNHRCSIRKQLKKTGKRHMEKVHVYQDVTPIAFAKQWLGGQNNSNGALKLLKKAGGIG